MCLVICHKQAGDSEQQTRRAVTVVHFDLRRPASCELLWCVCRFLCCPDGKMNSQEGKLNVTYLTIQKLNPNKM